MARRFTPGLKVLAEEHDNPRMTVEELEQHIIDVVRAAGRVEEIYPDRDNPGIVRLDVDGKRYVLTIVETVEPEDLLQT